jgi:hypothetical protein
VNARAAAVAGPRIAALLLGVVAAGWAAAPLLGAGWPAFALTVAAACVAAGSLRLALQDVPEPQEAYFLSTPERAARTALAIVRLLSWEEIGCVALLWLEVLHPARPWHTAVLGALLVAWLLTVHVAESGARPGGLLRRQAKILIAGACLLALGAAAAFLPGATSGGGAALHVLAAIAVIAAAVLVLPGLSGSCVPCRTPGRDVASRAWNRERRRRLTCSARCAATGTRTRGPMTRPPTTTRSGRRRSPRGRRRFGGCCPSRR